ncbi:MAG: Helix-turn-helix domain [Acidobacteriota bacterium]|jgi:transcriptional regulator with XRE-family HTH domain|nr:Helix-turn-helix domain [Acidobacteriota bacterium]
MGRAARERPKRLAEKLLQIRLALDLSQDGMVVRLGLDETLFRSSVSGYELGTREPSLPILLKYARCVGISTDVLIDDELNLPNKLLKASNRETISRTRTPRTNRKR